MEEPKSRSQTMNFLRRLFGRGCCHSFTWPRTDTNGQYYQICSLCGVAYEYDWETMKRTDHLLTAQARHA